MLRSVFSARRRAFLLTATLGATVLGAGLAPMSGMAQTIPISGLSPYDDGGDPDDPAAVTECNGAPQTGVVYRNSEAEPYLAINPVDPTNLIAGWHQDRWSTGGAQGLGAAFSRDGGTT